MKKLLLILFCLPFIGFGQDNSKISFYGISDCQWGDCASGLGQLIGPEIRLKTTSGINFEAYKYEYLGQFKGGKYDGAGFYQSTYDKGGNIEYKGEFMNGRFHGKGIYYDTKPEDDNVKTLPFDAIVINNTQRMKIDGIWRDGECISGDTSNYRIGCIVGDCYNGFGVNIGHYEGVYVGEWKDSYMHGAGFDIYGYDAPIILNGEYIVHEQEGNIDVGEYKYQNIQPKEDGSYTEILSGDERGEYLKNLVNYHFKFNKDNLSYKELYELYYRLIRPILIK